MAQPQPTRPTLGLSHINLNVADLGRSVRFYQEVFGLEVLQRTQETAEKDGRRVEICQVVLTTPGTHDLLALTQASGFPIGPGGVNHFGFIFTSNAAVQAAIAAAIRCGGAVTRQGERDGAGAREIFAYVRDPDGYAIELSTQASLLQLMRTRKAAT